MLIKPYCNSLTWYSRFLTREVKVGHLGIGGNNPIRLQSMTTTDTMDTKATVEQSIRMIEAGCELVRITAPSLNEAKNLEEIKKQLRAAGYNTPICADIHFTPNAAEWAPRIVEKVRVNPGNYADKKKFEEIEYTDAAYAAELERIRARFTPLVKICKEHGTAMRIGTNHGSLSDRILSRYGDTPLGMVESAMEFLRICEEHNYYDIILSMKASNTQVMVQAYRLLVQQMIETGRDYPLHLGVTEAGEGEDGRIKSAVGIGALLEDGLGDTIRVSLTEEPEFEIPVAKILADRYQSRSSQQSIQPETAVLNPKPGTIKPGTAAIELPYNPYEYEKRHSAEVLNIGGKNMPRVLADFSTKEKITHATLFACGYNYSVPLDKWNLSDQAADYVYAGDNVVDFELPGTLGVIYNSETWKKHSTQNQCYPLFCADEYFASEKRSDKLNFIAHDLNSLKDFFSSSSLQSRPSPLVPRTSDLPPRTLNGTEVFVFDTFSVNAMSDLRQMFILLEENNCKVPVIIKRNYKDIPEENFQLFSSTDIGALLLDGFGDGVWIKQQNCVSPKIVNSTAFGILQAARTRISKTEYISCPSCGRTLFDLQETTAKIRAVTDHLKGVKIGIMGCIVNGPGEMADADYGYVGTGPGKISLYKGREVVKKNVPAEEAVNELINLIKENGDWVEKPVLV